MSHNIFKSQNFLKEYGNVSEKIILVKGKKSTLLKRNFKKNFEVTSKRSMMKFMRLLLNSLYIKPH